MWNVYIGGTSVGVGDGGLVCSVVVPDYYWVVRPSLYHSQPVFLACHVLLSLPWETSRQGTQDDTSTTNMTAWVMGQQHMVVILLSFLGLQLDWQTTTATLLWLWMFVTNSEFMTYWKGYSLSTQWWDVECVNPTETLVPGNVIHVDVRTMAWCEEPNPPLL